jgi:hypothetical protein
MRLAPLRKPSKDSKKRVTEDTTTKVKQKRSKFNQDDEDNDSEWERIERVSNKVDNIGDDGDDDDDDDDDEEDDIPLQSDTKQITEEQYTFDFNDIMENHTESITTILKSSHFGNPTISYQIAQEIVNSAIGTCIVCDGGEDVFGFASVITLDQIRSSNSPLIKIVDELLANISKTATTSKIMKLFESQLKNKSNEVGILLHSRFANLPIQLISPLHKNIIDDIKWAKTEGTESEKALKSVLLLSVCNISDIENGNKKSSKSEALVSDTSGSSNVIHDYFENDIFCQHSIGVLQMKSSFMPNKTLSASLIEIDKLDKCLHEINNMLSI